MITDLLIPFVLATIILGLIPGPNVALTVANSLAHGTRYGLLTVAGTSSAMVPQLILTVMGLSTFITLLSQWFDVLRWAGVAYLVYLGIRECLAPVQDLAHIQAKAQSVHEIYWRGFLVSLTNPKTLLFYGAFFPQFIAGDAHVTEQLIVLALSFILVIGCIDSLWACMAGAARRYLLGKTVWRNRISGGFLIIAAILLAVIRVD
ncbi:MAG: LysE family translocator [Micavibrio aeruginosavorus]|uniref:LysE family translocator n=1 Tax=Micavibrio aeruginosavorus TaxID=349221 RepID=A0A7T5R3U5_9BACT|nr:MAG: LysE family translocator [Micavibrio aeruginosavorus]